MKSLERSSSKILPVLALATLSTSPVGCASSLKEAEEEGYARGRADGTIDRMQREVRDLRDACAGIFIEGKRENAPVTSMRGISVHPRAMVDTLAQKAQVPVITGYQLVMRDRVKACFQTGSPYTDPKTPSTTCTFQEGNRKKGLGMRVKNEISLEITGPIAPGSVPDRHGNTSENDGDEMVMMRIVNATEQTETSVNIPPEGDAVITSVDLVTGKENTVPVSREAAINLKNAALAECQNQ